MSVQGVFSSDSHIVGNRKQDLPGTLLRTMPTGSAQIYALSSGMKSRKAGDVIVNWFEENHVAGRLTISSFTTDGNGTSMVVNDASSIVPGVVLYNEERDEYVRVTSSDPATNTIVVVRNFDNGTKTLFVANDHLQRIGTSYAEGSNKPTAVSNLGYVVYNFCQIFRNVWNVTGTAQEVEFHTGSAVAKNKADCAMYHAEDIERSILWGTRALGVVDGQPFRTANGLYKMIATNVTAAGASTSWDDLDTFFKSIFEKNIKGSPNERVAYTGNGGLQVVNQIALKNATLNISVGQTDFGLQVNRLVTPYGTISLMTHPLMTESPFFTKDMLVFHPAGFEMRPLRPTRSDDYDKNGTRAGVDADYGVLTAEMSWEYHCEATGGLLSGLTLGIANT